MPCLTDPTRPFQILAVEMNYLLKELVINEGRNNVAKGILVYIYLGISICGGMLVTNFPNTLCTSSLVLLGILLPNQKTSYKLYLERLPLDLESE